MKTTPSANAGDSTMPPALKLQSWAPVVAFSAYWFPSKEPA